MTPRPLRLLAATAAISALAIAGCAKDDGAETRCSGGSASGSAAAGGSASGAASGSASGSGSEECPTTTAGGSGSAAASGSASGLGEDVASSTSDNPLVNQAVGEYQEYVEEQVTALVDDTKVFTDAVRDGDIEAAKASYATSRIRWERIEPIAALISDIDGKVDSRALEGVEDTEDPNIPGWHQLEYDLWVANDVSDSKAVADQLDARIGELKAGLPDLKVTPLAVTKGAQELIEEVADGKITGEEDRYSHTDLSDLNANVEGAKAGTDLMMPAIKDADPELATELETAFSEVEAALAPYKDGDGWKSYDEVSQADRTKLKAKFSALAEELAEVPGVLELS